MITYSARPVSMSGEISPVNAPPSSACMVCAPIFTGPPSRLSATARSQIAGGQTTAIASVSPSAPARTPPASSMAASIDVGFIFQLPTTSGVLMGGPLSGVGSGQLDEPPEPVVGR